MINANNLTKALIKHKIDHFFGVPDSLLKDLIASFDQGEHELCAHEGNAITSAMGHYLATKTPAVVYLQNSGLGNAINPLISCVHKKLNAIPMLIFVGWRGEAGKNDEPQHLIQGKNTLKMIDACEIDYEILSQNENKAISQITALIQSFKHNPRPIILLVKKNTFITKNSKSISKKGLERINVLKNLVENDPEGFYLATTGYCARELYALAKEKHIPLSHCYFHTGAMGHLASLALTLAKKSQKRIYLLDGDGSMLMHLGQFLKIANDKPKNLKIVCFNNQAHLSVGYHQSIATAGGLAKVLKSMGISTLTTINNKKALTISLNKLKSARKTTFVEIICQNKAKKDLPRPIETPKELMLLFQGALCE